MSRYAETANGRHQFRRTDLAGRAILWLVALSPLAFAGLSLALGQDANWDLRNYHWYNPYAFLNDRLLFDVAPAHHPTFYNPTLDIPFYLAATSAPAVVIGAGLGALQGINFILLFAIARNVLDLGDPRRTDLAAVTLATVGMLGGGGLAELGTVFYDNVVSLGVFAGLLIVITRFPALLDGGPWPAAGWVALAGLITGIGVGLKQPTVIFALGTCFAFLLMPAHWFRRLWLGFFFGIGVLAAIAITSGHWLWTLWTTFGNPLFPYFNDVFQSPWALPDPYRDIKFIPESAWVRTLFPFYFSFDPLRVGEIHFRDVRILAAFIALPVAGAALAWRWAGRVAKGQDGDDPAVTIDDRGRPPLVRRLAARYVVVSAILSYLAWLALFCIYRYAIPLEMLAPILIAIAVALWPGPRWLRIGITAASLALVQALTIPGDWERTGWGERFVEVDAPAIAEPDSTRIAMAGFAPLAYVIPSFPESVPFLRIHSYFLHPDQGNIGFNERVAERLDDFDGTLLMLFAPWEEWAAEQSLEHYGWSLDSDACSTIATNLGEDLLLCATERLE